MATDGIIADIGTIYKRLFNHRAVVQNEVQYFIQEFESKRGDNDLKLLQSSVKLASDINALYLEEMKESLPLFAQANEKINEIVTKGSKILENGKKDFDLPQDHTQKLENELSQLKEKYSQMRQEVVDSTDARLDELRAEKLVHKETIERLSASRVPRTPPAKDGSQTPSPTKDEAKIPSLTEDDGHTTKDGADSKNESDVVKDGRKDGSADKDDNNGGANKDGDVSKDDSDVKDDAVDVTSDSTGN